MANNITSVSSSEVYKVNRFDPKLFIFQTKLNKCKEKYHFVSLGDPHIATEIKRGQSPKPDTYKDKRNGKYIFVRTADVKKYQTNTESAVYLDQDTYSTQKSNRISSRDILISVVGNYLGSTCVIPDDIENGTFNDNSARIRIVDKNISPYYISAFLNSSFGQELIQSLVTRTGQKILSAGNVKKLSLPLINNPIIASKYELATQKESLSNTLIYKAQQLFYSRVKIGFKSIAKENVFSVSINSFSKDNLWTPHYSYPLYVNTLRSLKEIWKTIAVEMISDLKNGDEVGSANYLGYLDKRGTDVPFVRTSDIVNYGVDQFPDFYIPIEIYDELAQDIKANDILFTNDGKIGQVALVTDFDKFILQSHIKRIRLNKNAIEYGITPEYLFLALSIKEIGFYQSKRWTVIQSTIPTMANYLGKIEIPVLDKETINEITTLVRQAFNLKDAKKKLIAEVRETMDSYFKL